MELLQDLSSFPLLRNLAPEHVNSLVGVVHRVRFGAGDVLAAQGEAGTELIFLLSGAVDARSEAGLEAEFGPET